ncbi:MAG: MlaD family protein [Bacteroidota bacterium]
MGNSRRMRWRPETKVGLLAVTAFVILYVGSNFLRGKPIFRRTNTYYTIYQDAKGLTTSGPVLLNGLQVGTVRTIELLPDQDYSILVTLDINKHIQLTDATVAKLTSSNLWGDKVIELIIRKGTVQIRPYDTLAGQTEPDFRQILATHILPQLEDAAKNVALVSEKFMNVFAENTHRVDALLANLGTMVQQLEKTVVTNQTALHTLTQNLTEASRVLTDAESGLEPLLTNLNQLTHALAGVQTQALERKLHNVLDTLADGTLYSTLQTVLTDLDTLLVDLKKHPQRYIHFSIFGNANPPKLGQHRKPTTTSTNAPKEQRQ